MKIKWLDNPSAAGISQIYSSGTKFCFISENYEQCHSLVYCKDFLQDVILACLRNKSVSIYGFTYNPSKSPKIYMDKCRLALAHNDKTFPSRIESTVDFVNQFAKKIKLVPTIATEVNKPRGSSYAFVTEGSKMWMNSPPLISLYSLLLRVGLSHKKGTDFMETIDGVIKNKIKTFGSNDSYYLQSAKKAIDRILEMGYRKFFYIDSSKNFPDTNVSVMHGCGIVAMANNSTKSVVPYWHRKSLKK